MNETTKQDEAQEVSGSRHDRIVSALRTYLKVTPDMATDEELLEKTNGTLSRQLVEIELAKEDFAKAAKPIIEKTAKDIRDAFSKIRLRR